MRTGSRKLFFFFGASCHASFSEPSQMLLFRPSVQCHSRRRQRPIVLGMIRFPAPHLRTPPPHRIRKHESRRGSQVSYVFIGARGPSLGQEGDIQGLVSYSKISCSMYALYFPLIAVLCWGCLEHAARFAHLPPLPEGWLRVMSLANINNVGLT